MLEENQIIQDRYQLQKLLGKRPARQTWLAIDLQDKQQVVIKFLAFGGQIQWEDLKLFEREAQVLRELNHQYIPQYRDYFSIDDRVLWFALVEEYIEGFSLHDLLQSRKNFTESEVKNIARQLLKILIYLHQLNPQVLHRDIKPSNIILQNEKTIYLVDFGAVQDKAAAEGASFTVVGTYGYTPIEQFGGRANSQSDLYALGATLIHLLTHTPPADLPQKDLRLQFKELVNISSDFCNWLSKITEPAADNRFSSAQEALKILESNESVYSVVKEKNQEKNQYLKINKNHELLQVKIIASSPHLSLNFFIVVSLIGLILLILFSLFAILFCVVFGLLIIFISSILITKPFLTLIVVTITSILMVTTNFLIIYGIFIKIRNYISKLGLFNNVIAFNKKNYYIKYKILNCTYKKYYFDNKNFRDIITYKLDSKTIKIIIKSDKARTELIRNVIKLHPKIAKELPWQLIDEVKDWLKI